jgi:hypothetical protein
MGVTVSPAEFHMVHYDGDEIASIAERLMGQVGLAPDLEIRIEVDETTPLGRAKLASLDPATITAESGAFEDPKRPRQLGERSVIDVLGRLLFQLRDRLDPAFAAPPLGEDIGLQHSIAWDDYAVGRLAHLGYPSQRQRRLYHFRNRHGFTDVADAGFARLWDGDGLTWADVVAISDEAAGALKSA